MTLSYIYSASKDICSRIPLCSVLFFTWWRHQMETFFALLAICAGNSPVPNSPHKGQWRGALVFSLICVWINVWVNNREAGDLRRYRAHYHVTVVISFYRIHKDHNIFTVAILQYPQYPMPLKRPGWKITWWRHQLETFSVLLALCPGNSQVTGDFQSQRASNADFDVSLMWVHISCYENSRMAGDLRLHYVNVTSS